MTIRFWLPIRNEYIQHLMLKSRFPVKVIFFPTSQRTKKGFSKWHYKNTTSTAQNRSGIPEKIAPKVWFVHCHGSLSFAIFFYDWRRRTHCYVRISILFAKRFEKDVERKNPICENTMYATFLFAYNKHAFVTSLGTSTESEVSYFFKSDL